MFALIERMVEEGARKRDFVESLGKADLLMTPALEQSRARYRRALSTLLARAQEQGAVRADVQASDITALVKGVFAADGKARSRLVKILLAGLQNR